MLRIVVAHKPAIVFVVESRCARTSDPSMRVPKSPLPSPITEAPPPVTRWPAAHRRPPLMIPPEVMAWAGAAGRSATRAATLASASAIWPALRGEHVNRPPLGRGDVTGESDSPPDSFGDTPEDIVCS
ncbi:hypothetical protein GCM10007977_043350 [Dactylosporangium sucinum]|uniref:Uncharacterized protein n=1 Tax=Dactylosporangium sucinum TaxID=1424081 RepID=A0A917TTZ5_9ACTN|nr:hypothetical protein GCM10007977_043350 [Dactylosporangium sucinum]